MSISHKLCFTVHSNLFHSRYKGCMVINMFSLDGRIKTTYMTLVLITYAQKLQNSHAGLSIRARTITM